MSNFRFLKYATASSPTPAKIFPRPLKVILSRSAILETTCEIYFNNFVALFTALDKTF